MQEFNFPHDLDIWSFFIVLVSFLLFIVIACWLNGYFHKEKELDGRVDRLHGLPRANLWSKVASCLGLIVLLLTWLKWDECFYRLNISSHYVQVWFVSPHKEKTIVIEKDNIDSIHYGFQKAGSNCFVRIQLKNGTSYKSTIGKACKNAYTSLSNFVQSE